MPDSLPIGTVPAEESCAQLGITPDYAKLNRLECQAFIMAIKRKHGEPPEGVTLRIKGSDHDYGTYREVHAVFEPEVTGATPWAYKVEEDLPTLWEDFDMWPPVVYGDSGRDVVSVVESLELCDRTTNPRQVTTLAELTASA